MDDENARRGDQVAKVGATPRQPAAGGGVAATIAKQQLSGLSAPRVGTPAYFDARPALVAPPRAAKAIYSLPELRPCARIAPERGESVVVGLAELYGSLETKLPLKGGAAMGPVLAGGIRLTQGLRGALPSNGGGDLGHRAPAPRRALGRTAVGCLTAAVPRRDKSHLAREIARIAGVPMAALDLGAMHDAAALVSVSRGLTNTKPCWPAQAMSAHGCANPLLVLDELHKAGGSRRNGDPLGALLGMLEPSTARAYFDTSLMCEVDLSAVCWLATANDVVGLAAPLASAWT